MISMQEIVTNGIRGVVEQEQLSYSTIEGRCAYRHPGNSSIRCAIGHSIPNKQYNKNLEGKEVGRIMFLPVFDALHPFVDQLRKFQQCHDNATRVDHFKLKAHLFCETYGYTYPEDCL